MAFGHLIFTFFPNILSNIEIYFMDPIIEYMNPQNLRFFGICGVSTALCPNHYITITSIFATWFLRCAWRTQCPQKSGVWCIPNWKFSVNFLNSLRTGIIQTCFNLMLFTLASIWDVLQFVIMLLIQILRYVSVWSS